MAEGKLPTPLGQAETIERSQGKPTWGQPGFKLPSERQEFKFEGKTDSLPEWIDRGWIGSSNGVALKVPRGDPSKQPYTTQTARKGDTVVYEPGKNNVFGKFVIIPADPSKEGASEDPTFRPAQETQASLEDLVSTGTTPYERMDDDAKAQMFGRRTGGPAMLPPEGSEGVPPAPPPQPYEQQEEYQER